MFRNETGLQVLESGDEVRVGNGKVLYNVSENYTENGTTVILSQNTQRLQTVETARLTLITNIRDTDVWKAKEEFAAFPDLELQANEESAEAAAEYREGHEYPETEEPVKEDTEYQKAVLLALNLKGKHVYAGTVRDNVKAKRRSLGRRQKASRVANRG